MKKWLGGSLGGAGVLIASAANAFERGDSPGGPAMNQFNMHEPITRIAAEIGWLHWMMLAICFVIFLGVFGVMFYSIWAHRKSRGAKPAAFHESLGVEVAWTGIPFIIVVAMALPATKTIVAMKDPSTAERSVNASCHQGIWVYVVLN